MVTTQTIVTPPTGSEAPKPAEAAPAERPKWLPEKFKTPEDMAASYVELEKKLGSTQPAATPTQQTTAAESQPATTPAAQPQQTPEQKADFSKYTEEFSKAGKLSDQTYAEIAAKHGLAKSDVDNYIAGQQAQAKVITAEIHAAAGGEQQFKNVIAWASQNLPQAEKDAYNKAATTGDYATVKLAVAGMVAKFNTAYGTNPSLVGGRTPDFSGPKPFSSWAQVTEAMSDKRYASDEGYRKEVSQRISASQL